MVGRVVAVALVLVLAAPLVLSTAEPAAADVRDATRLLRRPGHEAEGLAALTDVSDAELRAARRGLLPLLARLARKADEGLLRAAAGRLLVRLSGDDANTAFQAALASERDAATGLALAAACASADPDDDGLRRGLANAAYGDDPRVAALAAEALGALPEAAGVPDLLALLVTGPHWAVVTGAMRGLAVHRVPSVPPVLLRHLRHPDVAVRAEARESLVRLTGTDLGVDPARWEAWWEDNGDAFVFPDREGDAPPESRPERGAGPTSDDWEPAVRPTFARFFGISLRGRDHAFVIDFSQSMWGPRRNEAQAQLIEAVKGLPGRSRFSVILFNEKVWSFNDIPLPASPQAKLDLVTYLPDQETKSYTNIYDALERAFGLTGVGSQAIEAPVPLDEIVLLSDGVPNRGKIKDSRRILEAITALNTRSVRLHTVSLGHEQLELLPALAEQNGGRHVHKPHAK